MRRVVLGALIALGAVTMTVRAAQQPAGQPAPMVVEVEKLRDNFYVMRGRRRRQQRRLHHADRRRGGRHQEPRVG